jgi:hypothetical protein
LNKNYPRKQKNRRRNRMPNGDISELVERAVGGPAIEESIVLNELESVFEEELQALLDIDREDTSRQEDLEYYAQLLEALAQSDPSVRDTTLQRIEKYKERLTDFKSYLEGLAEFPEAEEIDEEVTLGSYYVRKKPPFDYPWASAGAIDNADNRCHSYPRTGRITCFSEGGGEGGEGIASCVAGVGVYYTPPIRSGRLQVRSSPSIFSEGMALSSFCWSKYKTWLGIRAYKFSVGSNRYQGIAADLGRHFCINDAWWNAKRCSQKYTSFYRSLNFPVDSSHWYAIFVYIITKAGGGGSGFLHYGAGIADMRSTVPYISLSLS